MKQKIYKTCTSCPAALVCRSSDVHYTHVCPRCGRPWITLLPDALSEHVFMIILHEDNCEDRGLSWVSRDTCPTCDGDMFKLWLGSEKTVHLFDVDTDL